MAQSPQRQRGQHGYGTLGHHAASLGGAHLIHADYLNLHNRAAHPRGPRPQSAASVDPTRMATRLSANRAARRAATDITGIEHVHNVYHLTRRIEDMYNTTERQKNTWDPTAHPVYLRRHSGSPQRPSLHQQLVDPWLQGQGYNVLASARPGTAPSPSPRSSYPSPAHPQPRAPSLEAATAVAKARDAAARRRGRDGRDSYLGWSVGPSLKDTFPADDFPLLRPGAKRLSTEYRVYKKAVMQEIIGNRMFREHQLRALFTKYVKLAPLHDKEIVECVVADLKGELGVC